MFLKHKSKKSNKTTLINLNLVKEITYSYDEDGGSIQFLYNEGNKYIQFNNDEDKELHEFLREIEALTGFCLC